MKLLKFVKEKGCWYIDLPNWVGRKSALRMVSGADTMLEIIGNGEDVVYLYVDVEYFEDSDSIVLINRCWFNGANYKNTKHNQKIWLCNVTKFVMNGFPERIYFAKAKIPVNFETI